MGGDGIGVVGDPGVIRSEDGSAVERTSKTLVRDGEGAAVGTVDGDPAGPDGKTVGVNTLRVGGGDGDGGRATSADGDLAGAELDTGVLSNDVVRESIRVNAVASESVESHGVDVADAVGHSLGVGVGDLDLRALDVVVGVVEGDARGGDNSLGEGSVVSLDETATLLLNGSLVVVELNTIVEHGGVGSGGKSILDGLGVEGLENLGHQSVDTSSLGSGHGGTREDSVRAELDGPSGEDVTTGSTELGLEIHLPSGTPGGVGGESSGSDRVGRADELERGLIGTDKGCDNLLSSLEGVDPGNTLVGSNHGSSHNLGVGASNGHTESANSVVVDEDVLGTGSGGVVHLLHESAATTADEDDVATEIRSAGRVRIASTRGVGRVGGRSIKREADLVPGIEIALSPAKVGLAAAIDSVAADGEKSRGLSVVEGGNGGNGLAISSTGGVELTSGTLVTSGNGAGNALGDNSLDGNSPRILGPTRRSTDGGSDDISTVLVSLVESSNEDIVTDAALATQDTVSTESDIGSGTSEAVLVGLGSNDTSNVGTVTSAVHRVLVRNWGVGAGVSVTDEISTEGDEAARAEAAAQCRVRVVDLMRARQFLDSPGFCSPLSHRVVRPLARKLRWGRTYTSVDLGDLDALAKETLLPQLVNLGHDVRRVLGVIQSSALLVSGGTSGGIFGTSPDDLWLGDAVELDRVDVLDRRVLLLELHSVLIGILDIVKLNGSTLPELVVEVHTGVTECANMAEELGGILSRRVLVGRVLRPAVASF